MERLINNGDYYWEVLKENDGSEVFRIILGNADITLFYGKDTLSIRMFRTIYTGGDVFYLKVPFDQTGVIVKALLEGHNLELMPLYIK